MRSVSHLLFNMLILFFCGRFVELALGWKLMGVVYLTGAIAGGLAEVAWSPGSLDPVLGASGAIAAIIAGYMVLFARNRPKPVGPLPAEIARGAQLLDAANAGGGAGAPGPSLSPGPGPGPGPA